MGPTTTVSFPVLGRRLEARAIPPRLARWLRRTWRYPRSHAPRHNFAITLEVLRAAPPALEGEERLATVPEGVSIPWRNRGDEWETGDIDGGLRLTFDPRGARIRLWAGQDWSEWSEGGHLSEALYLAICEALRRSGLVPLHAAVIVREGQATALAGRSGAGKSSLLLRSLSAGWQPLAEDLAWLDPATLTVHGWDRGVRLGPEGRLWLESEVRPGYVGWLPDGHGKFILPYDRLPAQVANVATLTRLAEIRRDAEDEAVYEALPPREAVRVFWEAAGVPLTPIARAALARLIPFLIARLEVNSIRLPKPVDPLYSPPRATVG